MRKLIVVLLLSAAAFAQAAPIETPKNKVSVVSLANPVYPPIARTAHVMGDVEVKLGIRKDGSVESAVAVSGHKMLIENAVNSARQSKFQCNECSDDVTYYTMIYSFGVATALDPDWPCPKDNSPRVTQSGNHVSIEMQPRVVSGEWVNIKVRSSKCLYLWKCGLQNGGYSYYYYRVRSAKCLGLWDCGSKMREPYATCKRLNRPVLE